MNSLKKAALWMSGLAILVKLSGFLRESVIASQFGVSEVTDGYLLAFSFITLVLAMIANGFNNVFLPQYVQNRKERPEETEQNANGIMNATVLIFIAATAVGFFLVPFLVPFIFGNMQPGTEAVAVSITQVFVAFMSMIALNGILDSYLQGRRIFVPTQLSKLSQTLLGAVFALAFSEWLGIHSLAYGFIVGVFLGIVIQLIFLFKNGYKWSPTLRVERDYRKAFLVLLVPALLNSVVGQVNMFVNKFFASGTTEGAVTYLNNASLLVTIPHNLYATTVATIIFTLLAERASNQRQFQQTVFEGLRLSYLTLLPTSVGLFIVGQPALEFIYERGAFTSEDTYATYLALIFYLPMIVTQGMQYIVSKAMYAQHKTAVVFRISVTTIALNAFLNWLFVYPLDFGYPGLALSSSAVSFYYVSATIFFVYKDFPPAERTRLWSMILRGLPAVLLMALPLFLLQQWDPFNGLYSLAQLAILVPIGGLLYIVGLRFFYREGFRQLLQLLRIRTKGRNDS
ncbi:murein biosynthesis integral membrane protein MurJ [Bacillus fonticola]|uniref:murein biosynthesis integral membrane protein MurJ n=1 Tax=Bacillus fonticola TaxID=2728853 RepID=UPI001474E794|nr:murein biosynthesis integral membrane protein MurJ [Bacillus fonticola]